MSLNESIPGFSQPEQIANGLAVMDTSHKASHLTAQRRFHAHVEQRQPGFESREDTDQPVGFDSNVFYVNGNESQSHYSSPPLAEGVGDHVSLNGTRHEFPGGTTPQREIPLPVDDVLWPGYRMQPRRMEDRVSPQHQLQQ